MAKKNQVTDYFKLTIENYLEQRAQSDELFAPRYANPKKNIDDCITFMLNTIKNMGVAGLTDDEVYSLALHYYDEDDIEVGSPIKCKVMVNHTIELTEQEKAEARQKAMQRAQNEAYEKITKTKAKAKKTETIIQPSLF